MPQVAAIGDGENSLLPQKVGIVVPNTLLPQVAGIEEEEEEINEVNPYRDESALIALRAGNNRHQKEVSTDTERLIGGRPEISRPAIGLLPESHDQPVIEKQENATLTELWRLHGDFWANVQLIKNRDEQIKYYVASWRAILNSSNKLSTFPDLLTRFEEIKPEIAAMLGLPEVW